MQYPKRFSDSSEANAPDLLWNIISLLIIASGPRTNEQLYIVTLTIASELLEYLEEMFPRYYIDSDAISRFKYPTTHRCVTRLDSVKHAYSTVDFTSKPNLHKYVFSGTEETNVQELNDHNLLFLIIINYINL